MSKALQEVLLSRRVRPLPFLAVGIAVAALLVSIGIVVWLATSSPRDIWAPRVIARTYSSVSLAHVVSELEADQIIPGGSRWPDPALEALPVTANLRILSTDFEALDQIAVAAHVHIQVPVGQHGEIRGPINIRATDPAHRAGAWGHHYSVLPR